MRSKRYRRSGNVITAAIDRAVDHRLAHGLPVVTRLVAHDVTLTLPAAVMFAAFETLLGQRVRTRLKARGLLVVDDQTWERTVDTDVTDVDFKVTRKVLDEHIAACVRRQRADRQVEKFLDSEAAKLGRPVTMGEYQAKIDKIYASHGYTG